MPQIAALRVPLLTAATTGTSQSINVSAYTHLTVYVKTNGSPGAGTVVLEEADYDPDAGAVYSGTWSTIAMITLTSDVGNSSQYAYHVGGTGGSYDFAFFRARIGTTVTSTTVDVTLRAV